MMKKIVIFCANQVSLCLADEIVRRAHNYNIEVIYGATRCDIGAFDALKKISKPYSKTVFLSLFMRTVFLGRMQETIIPNFKWRAASLIAMISKKVSLIDDGLDTFREMPKNLDVASLAEGTVFYTFDYPQTARWVDRLTVAHICSIDRLAFSSKSNLGLEGYDTVIIESPGIHKFISQPGNLVGKCLLVKHSNFNKNLAVSVKCDQVSGADFAIERSLKKYHGRIIVGESMVGVYLMSLLKTSFKVELCVNEGNLNNLRVLSSIAKKSPNVVLHIIK